MPTINVQPKEFQNGDRVTVYNDTVGMTQETFTFLTAQETIILKNKGTKSITYTIGGNSGTLGPSEFVKVTGSFSSLSLSSEKGTQAFEIWAEELGTNAVTPEVISDLTSKLAQITPQIVTSDTLSSATMDYEYKKGVIISKGRKAGVANPHPFVLLPPEIQSLTFKHIRDDDWIGLGGDDTRTTAIAIGNPYNIRLTDLGPTNGTNTSITVADKPILGDLINFSWNGNILVAKKDKNDGNGFQSWFTVDLTAYSNLQHYKLGKRFSTVFYYQNTVMNLMQSPTAQSVFSLSDRVQQAENTLFQNTYKYFNKLWNAVGDSITAQAKYLPIVTNSTGLNAVNYGLSSSTIAINNSYLTNKSMVERIIGLNGNTAYGDADVWTVFGGVNDWYYQTPLGSMADTTADRGNFYGALKAICENILNRTNNPLLVFFTPLQSNRNGANTSGVTMNQYRQAIKDVCDYYSVPVIDLYGMGGFNPVNLSKYTSDNVHPNDLGTSVYAPRIANFLNSLK